LFFNQQEDEHVQHTKRYPGINSRWLDGELSAFSPLTGFSRLILMGCHIAAKQNL
jgi:hypothetical protein